MSKTIDLQDSEAAIELVQFAYFKKVLEKGKKRHKEESDVETEEEEMSQEDGDSKKRRKAQTEDGKGRKRRRELKEGEQYDPYDFSDAEGETPDIPPRTPKTPEAEERMDTDDGAVKKPVLSDQRLKEFKAALLDAFKSAHAQSLGMQTLMASINKDNKEPFSDVEVQTALDKMQEDNQIMVSDHIIFLI
ncbi:hypothetical protein scyTo_0019758 [Scyliorhinus torazame]|uniref:MCM3-like winged helix domain-containing protein n=3 Tax=Scyliorhinus torazame TaxID=75743 RepID=A0A401PQI2_SCYTO|nr:hypothetical protein [Scyliorhinus torazame]